MRQGGIDNQDIEAAGSFIRRYIQNLPWFLFPNLIKSWRFYIVTGRPVILYSWFHLLWQLMRQYWQLKTHLPSLIPLGGWCYVGVFWAHPEATLRELRIFRVFLYLKHTYFGLIGFQNDIFLEGLNNQPEIYPSWIAVKPGLFPHTYCFCQIPSRPFLDKPPYLCRCCSLCLEYCPSMHLWGPVSPSAKIKCHVSQPPFCSQVTSYTSF